MRLSLVLERGLQGLAYRYALPCLDDLFPDLVVSAGVTWVTTQLFQFPKPLRKCPLQVGKSQNYKTINYSLLLLYVCVFTQSCRRSVMTSLIFKPLRPHLPLLFVFLASSFLEQKNQDPP